MLEAKTASALRGLVDEYRTMLLLQAASLDGAVAVSFMHAARQTTDAVRSICLILGFPANWQAPEVTAAVSWAEAVALLDPAQARRVSEVMVRMSDRLTESFRLVPASEETTELRSALGRWLGFIYTDILRELWARYPNLSPAEMGQRP